MARISAADLAAALKGAKFPARKEDLIDVAIRNILSSKLLKSFLSANLARWPTWKRRSRRSRAQNYRSRRTSSGKRQGRQRVQLLR